MGIRRAIAAALVTSAAANAGAAISLAATSPYTAVLRAYQTHGSIPPCQFSSPELAAALRGVDAYGQQYFADFGNAVQAALAARAAGACGPGPHPVGGSAAPQAPLPASATSPTDAGVPLVLILLAALSLFIGLALGAAALARRLGWDPPGAASWRHAWAEAAYRLDGRRADLADRRRARRR